MKKLTISVVLGSMLFSGSVMSSENYRPREFWDNTEVAEPTLEQTFIIAQAETKRRLFKCSGNMNRFLACEIAKGIYPLITNFTEQNCLEPLSMDDFLASLDLRGLDEVEWVPWEHVWNFLSYVGSILGKEIN